MEVGIHIPVEVGVHQGSVLSPATSLIIVMEALSKRFDDRGLPWELLYADDLVLLADSEEDLKRKLPLDGRVDWRQQGLRVKCRENDQS